MRNKKTEMPSHPNSGSGQFRRPMSIGIQVRENRKNQAPGVSQHSAEDKLFTNNSIVSLRLVFIGLRQAIFQFTNMVVHKPYYSVANA